MNIRSLEYEKHEEEKSLIDPFTIGKHIENKIVTVKYALTYNKFICFIYLFNYVHIVVDI